jgi:hypothetical protein
LRSFFNQKKHFPTVFNEINLNNQAFNELVEEVQCYKVELGQVLVKVGATYNILFECLLELAYQNNKDTKAEVDKKIFERSQKQKEVDF